MFASTKKPYNPNKKYDGYANTNKLTTTASDWDKSDLCGILHNIQTISQKDITITGNDYTVTSSKYEIVAELIATMNCGHYNVLCGMRDIIKQNNTLINITENRNKSVDYCVKKMNQIEIKLKGIHLLLTQTLNILPDMPLNDFQSIIKAKNIIDDISFNVYDSSKPRIDTNIIQPTHPTINGSPEQIIELETTQSANQINNTTTNIIVKSPSADLAVSDLNENISTQITSTNPRLFNITEIKSPSTDSVITLNKNNIETLILSNKPSPINPLREPQINYKTIKTKQKKKKIKNNTYNKQKNKNKNHQKNKKKSLINKKNKNNLNNKKKHSIRFKNDEIKKTNYQFDDYEMEQTHVLANECTRMTLPYKPNKQQQQNNYKQINPIRKDIDTKTRYGIYCTSKSLEKQIQDIKPYEEYIKDEQHAYNELNKPINYAVFNR